MNAAQKFCVIFAKARLLLQKTYKILSDKFATNSILLLREGQWKFLDSKKGPNVGIKCYFRCHNLSSLTPEEPGSSVDSLLYLPSDCLRPQIAFTVSLAANV